MTRLELFVSQCVLFLQLVLLRRKNSFEPRLSNEILVPFKAGVNQHGFSANISFTFQAIQNLYAKA